jgi:Putative zinc-finger
MGAKVLGLPPRCMRPTSILWEVFKWNLAMSRKKVAIHKVDGISTIFLTFRRERSMMRHVTIESLIGLADGTLSPKDKREVEDHIVNCPRCFAEASEFLVVESRTCIESRTKS